MRTYFWISLFTSFRISANSLIESNVILIASKELKKNIFYSIQGKVLRMITDAPWYVPNMVLSQDLQITSVKEEIHRFSTQYRDRLYTHRNLTWYLDGTTRPQATVSTSAHRSVHQM
jgi:hypothetical protein